MGFSSTHFVNLSKATRRWVYPPGAVLNFPTISMPHTANGHVRGMVFSVEPDMCDWLAYF
jgi:hypothetical protein